MVQGGILAEATMQQVAGRVPTLVNVSNFTTDKTIYYAHYDAVAAKISIPLKA